LIWINDMAHQWRSSFWFTGRRARKRKFRDEKNKSAMRHLKYAAIIAATLVIPTAAAMAQPWSGGNWGPGMMYGYGPEWIKPQMMYGYGPGWGGPGMMYGYGPGWKGPYGYGPGSYYGGPEADSAKVDAAAKQALGKATEAKSWTQSRWLQVDAHSG
jgi:hypothetical protein